jgi:hypothetical protein
MYVIAGAVERLRPGGAGAVSRSVDGRIGDPSAGTNSQPQAAIQQHFSAVSSGGSQQW